MFECVQLLSYSITAMVHASGAKYPFVNTVQKHISNCGDLYSDVCGLSLSSMGTMYTQEQNLVTDRQTDRIGHLCE